MRGMIRLATDMRGMIRLTTDMRGMIRLTTDMLYNDPSGSAGQGYHCAVVSR